MVWTLAHSFWSFAARLPKKNMASSWNLDLLCADLYELAVKPESVDLVAGSSILHHMIDPAPIVRLALAALRPGGTAIFTEPFENGHGLLMNAYRTALSLEAEQALPIPENLRTFMQEVIQDFDARRDRECAGRVRVTWMTSGTSLEAGSTAIAHEMNCDLQILPTHAANETVFQDTFEVLARLHNSADTRDAPPWVHAIVRAIDDNFSLAQSGISSYRDRNHDQAGRSRRCCRLGDKHRDA